MRPKPGWGVGGRLPGIAATLVLAALALPLLRAAPGGTETSGTAPAAADRLYAEKSYAGALGIYERLLQAGSVPAGRRDEVQYRVGVSLGKALQWDRALAESLAFVQSHRGTVWEPRGLYWLGRLYMAVPHEGWRVGKRVYRGAGVPKTDADARPEQVSLGEQDARNARDALEAARIFFPAYRAQAQTADEEIQLNFDLARVLQRDPETSLWAQKQEWAPPADAGWQVDPDAAYSPEWAPPKKQVYLYTQIERLAGNEPPRSHFTALALLGKALWLQEYRAAMQSWALKWKNGKPVSLPYPYQNLQPEATLRRILKEFSTDSLRDHAQITLAQLLASDGRLAEAAAEYRRLIAARPRSMWVADARTALEQITRRELSLDTMTPQVTRGPASVEVSYRNVRRIHFEVARVRLEDIIATPQHLRDPKAEFSQFPSSLKQPLSAPGRFGPVVARWDVATRDRGDYQGRSQSVKIPAKKIGAYLVQASAPGIRVRTVVLVTDLVVVQKLHRDGALFFVADALSGAPVPNAVVIAKQWWEETVVLPRAPTRPRGRPQLPARVVTRTHCAIVRGRTNADGILTMPLQRAEDRRSFQTAALVYRAGRYAYTSRLSTSDYGDNPGTFRGYAITDRAVYRPAQTVHYRQMVMRRVNGEWRPAANQQLRVEVRDPAGKLIHQDQRTATGFGSVSGEFALGTEAPLGEYTIGVMAPGESLGVFQSGGNRFRVEEYKKPEFEVTVTPAAERVRLGQPTSARIAAKYYFGGPVAGAKVTYRIYRGYYIQSYNFPRPFDFLYGDSSAGDYETDYRNGEVLTQGEARTDAKGEAKITFPTSSPGSRWGNSDLSYTVDADVQDASRRVISGSGSVKATHHDVAVFLDFPHGYATRGDRVDVEVMTLNPSNEPVPVSGTAKVFRQPHTPDGRETQVFAAPLKTDSHGHAILQWTASAGGRYRIAFETCDSAKQVVKGSVPVWVAGPELARRRFLFQGVFLAVENPHYEEGQQARVLLVTPEPECTILLTREANNEILERRVLRVSGRSLELELALARRDAPNVYLSAVMIRNGQMHQATQELFVPPARQFAAVTVQADKERYQPGETARLALQARDWQGRPLRTELSVSVTDAALAYIQKEYAPEIRAHFYGDRRSESISTEGSPDASFEVDMVDHQPTGHYGAHRWVPLEGMGQLSDWPGGPWLVSYKNENLSFMSGYSGAGPYYSNGFRVTGGAFQNAGARIVGYSDRVVVGSQSNGLPIVKLRRSGVLSYPLDNSLIVRGDPEARSLEALERLGVLAASAVRSKFADTAFWTPAVVTDAAGNATVEVTWPDNLTQWRAAAVGTSATAQVGSGETRVTTKKDLLVRLQAPRFFVERDTVTLSANVHNYLPRDVRARVSLDLGGDLAVIEGAGGRASERAGETWVDLPAGGERRVDWTVRVVRVGELRARMTAQTEGAADAMETAFPVIVHGVERQTAQGGVLRQDKQAQVTITLPRERKPGSSGLIVQLNPSLRAVMLDALPYLADYPYGCIEQTMSRFLPSVVVAKTLKSLGYDLEALGRRAREGAAERASGRAGERASGRTSESASPYTYPKGRPGTVDVAGLAQVLRRSHAPVFDSAQLKGMVVEGLGRIASFQHDDGGWGWWPADSSDPYMTAYVLYGLITARDAGYAVDAGMLDRGLSFLRGRFLEDDNLHRMAYAARVLALDPGQRDAIRPLATGRLYENRERLSPYSKALLALALHALGEAEKAGLLLRNLETTAKVDAANGTANWEGSEREWWRWYHNKVETNAAVLQAYMAIRPEAPLAPRVMKWLVNNRRGGIWHSTRETAMAVYALADYVRVNKELAPEYTLTVDLGGRVQRSYTVTRENALFFDNAFVVPDELLETGAQTLTITKNGPGTLYYTAYTRYFSLEEPIPAAGNEIAVQRHYFRLLPGTASGTPEPEPLDPERPNPFLTGQYELLSDGGTYVEAEGTAGGPRYERVALRPGEMVTSGDLLEVELQLESKNDYDYLVFEDLKPAGCEPVELRSGSHAGGGLYANMELRDEKVAFFLTSLPQGARTLSYRLRAEIPGAFHVLPTNGYAMYAPDIRALSDEMRLDVRDEGEKG